MEIGGNIVIIIAFVSLSSSPCFLFTASSSSPLPYGIHPLDEKYYFGSEVIKCRDGSNSFSRDRINDNYCDCPDGSDEPGTSACPAGKFYCRNAGSTPRFLFSSCVNDHICDCCDGSDEYDGHVHCPNTCVMGGNVEYRRTQYSATMNNRGSIDTKVVLNRLDVAESVQKLKGLKVVIIIQMFFIVVVVGFRIFHRGFRSRRRLSR